MTIVFSNAVPQCPLCGQLVDAESIFFPWFTTDDEELLRLSATVAHFGCVKRHPRFGALQKIFRDALGPDRQKPNGSIVFSVGERTRAVWVRQWDMLHFLYAPLMLIVEAPRSSLRAAAAATGTNFSTRIGFEQPGIGATIESTGDHWVLHVQVCGPASVPSSADPDGIMHWKRSTSIEELQNWLADMGRAVAQADSLDRMNP